MSLDERRQHQKGMAILVTIAVVTVLIAVVLEMNRKVRSAVVATATSRDLTRLSEAAAAGVHLAMALLVKDKYASDIDSMQEEWADPERLAAIVDELPLEGIKLRLAVSDELSRIQVNALVNFPTGNQFNEKQRLLWERFLEYMARQAEDDAEIETDAVINAVKDWIDRGDDDAISGLSGAESDYYEGLEPPYRCKNAPMAHLGELDFVKDLTPEVLDGIGVRPGLRRFLTVYGLNPEAGAPLAYSGKININTAELSVLTALLPVEHEDLAQSILEYREARADEAFVNDLDAANWYKQAPGCGDLTIDAELITTASDLFRIEAAAVREEIKMEVAAVVQREKEPKSGKWTCKVLSWQLK